MIPSDKNNRLKFGTLIYSEMAEGDRSDDEVPAVGDVDEIRLVEFEPQYVIDATIIVEGAHISLLLVRIPCHHNDVD